MIRENESFCKIFLKSFLIFIIIVITLCIVLCTVLYTISIPLEKKGVNNKILEFPLDIYIINNMTSLETIYYFVNESNQIWNKYNITLTIKNISYINKEIYPNEISTIFNTNNCTLINPIIDNITKNNPNVTKIIFLSNNGSVEGRGCICDCNFIILNNKKDGFSGWNFAHEVGHIFGIEKQCWKWNLMTETSFECKSSNILYNSLQGLSFTLRKSLKPKFLTQKQLDNVINNY